MAYDPNVMLSGSRRGRFNHGTGASDLTTAVFTGRQPPRTPNKSTPAQPPPPPVPTNPDAGDSDEKVPRINTDTASTVFDFENDGATVAQQSPHGSVATQPISSSILGADGFQPSPPQSSRSSASNVDTERSSSPLLSDIEVDEDEAHDGQSPLFPDIAFSSYVAPPPPLDAATAAQLRNDLTLVRPNRDATGTAPVYKQLTRTHHQLDMLQSMVLKSGALSYSYKQRGVERKRPEAVYDMFSTCVPHEDPLRDQQFVAVEVPTQQVTEQFHAVLEVAQEHCHPTFALALSQALGMLLDHMQRRRTTTRLSWGAIYGNPLHRSHLLQALVAFQAVQAAQQGQSWLRNSVLMLNESELLIAYSHFKQYM